MVSRSTGTTKLRPILEHVVSRFLRNDSLLKSASLLDVYALAPRTERSGLALRERYADLVAWRKFAIRWHATTFEPLCRIYRL